MNEHDRVQDPVGDLTGELARCLQSFLEARADELTMRRAVEALATWEALECGSRSSPVLAAV